MVILARREDRQSERHSVVLDVIRPRTGAVEVNSVAHSAAQVPALDAGEACVRVAFSFVSGKPGVMSRYGMCFHIQGRKPAHRS